MASIAHHVGSLVWVPEKGVDGTLFRSKKVARWVRGRVAALRPGADGQPGLEVVTEEGATHVLAPADAPLQNERDDTVDDLVKSDFLHEPGCARPPAAGLPAPAPRRAGVSRPAAAWLRRRGSGEGAGSVLPAPPLAGRRCGVRARPAGAAAGPSGRGHAGSGRRAGWSLRAGAGRRRAARNRARGADAPCRPAQDPAHAARAVHAGHDLHVQRQHPHRGAPSAACPDPEPHTRRAAGARRGARRGPAGRGGALRRGARATGQPAQAAAAPVRRAHDDAIPRRAARRAEPARVRHRRAGGRAAPAPRTPS